MFVAMIVGTMIGPAGPTWWRIPLEFANRLPFVQIDSGVSQADWNIVWLIRTPRVVLAAIVGSMLSVSGASYQGVFRNPLVDPYLLGVAAGAGLGATLVFAFQRGATENWIIDPLPLAAFVGALVAVLVTYVVGTAFGTTQSSTTLILAGVAVTSLATSIQAFILQRNTDVVRQVYSWILGRLSSATWGDVRLVLPYVVLSTGVLLMHRRLLDVLRVGDDEQVPFGVGAVERPDAFDADGVAGLLGGSAGEVDADRVTFKYGLGEEMIGMLRTLHTLGLDSTDPVDVKGVRVSPRDVVAAVLPDPATIGPRM